MRTPWRIDLGAAALAVFAAASPSATAQDQVRFPVVFESSAQMRPLGISIKTYEGDGAAKPPLKNTCYHYGEASTVYLISYSDEFLERYRRRGFSRESLCLALVSQTRFDPETGKRLPTYVLVHPKHLEAALKGKDRARLTKADLDMLSERGVMTDELPLIVPDCFKNGTPFLDCNMRFGPTTGVPVRAVTRKRFRDFGEAYDRQVVDAIKSGKELNAADAGDVAPYLPIAGYWGLGELYEGQPKSVMVPDAIWEGGAPFPLTWTVLSPNLPRGYGYALHATGELGPGVSTGALRSVLGEKRSQVSTSSLRRMIQD